MINSLFPVKNPNLHKFIIIMLAVFTFFLIGLALILPLQPAGLPLPDWQADLNGTLTNWKAPKFSMIHPGITELTLRTTFPKVNADTLVIPHISGNSINVLLNHKPIYQLGNPSAPTSNLWNSVTVVQLPEPLLAQNELEIHISSVSTAVGLNAVPYLTNFSADAAHIWLLTWIDYDFLQAAAGMAFILGLILIILSFLRRKLGGTEFYTGLTLLFSVIFYQDDLFRLTSGDLSTFLWAKKIFLISGFLLTLSLMLWYRSE